MSSPPATPPEHLAALMAPATPPENLELVPATPPDHRAVLRLLVPATEHVAALFEWVPATPPQHLAALAGLPATLPETREIVPLTPPATRVPFTPVGSPAANGEAVPATPPENLDLVPATPPRRPAQRRHGRCTGRRVLFHPAPSASRAPQRQIWKAARRRAARLLSTAPNTAPPQR